MAGGEQVSVAFTGWRAYLNPITTAGRRNVSWMVSEADSKTLFQSQLTIGNGNEHQRYPLPN